MTEARENPPEFTRGDHLYRLILVNGINTQHHGIFIDSYWSDNGWILRIAEYNNNVDDNNITEDNIRYAINEFVWNDTNEQWNNIEYNESECDIPDRVLLRALFLIRHPNMIPLDANCECVAVWCKTGCYCTKKGLKVLQRAPMATAIGVVGVAIFPVTVPMSGVLGWIGLRATVSLAVAQPWLIPVIVGVGCYARNQLRKHSRRLNKAFYLFEEQELREHEPTHDIEPSTRNEAFHLFEEQVLVEHEPTHDIEPSTRAQIVRV